MKKNKTGFLVEKEKSDSVSKARQMAVLSLFVLVAGLSSRWHSGWGRGKLTCTVPHCGSWTFAFLLIFGHQWNMINNLMKKRSLQTLINHTLVSKCITHIKDSHLMWLLCLQQHNCKNYTRISVNIKCCELCIITTWCVFVQMSFRWAYIHTFWYAFFSDTKWATLWHQHYPVAWERRWIQPPMAEIPSFELGQDFRCIKLPYCLWLQTETGLAWFW